MIKILFWISLVLSTILSLLKVYVVQVLSWWIVFTPLLIFALILILMFIFVVWLAKVMIEVEMYTKSENFGKENVDN